MSRIQRVAQFLRTPKAVQNFLRSLNYNDEKSGPTIRSAEMSLRVGKCHCLEAVFIAAAILEHHGYDPFVLSMESQDELDHVVFLFQEKTGWGTIGRSRDEGLHGRAPRFLTIEDVVRSYFEPYVDKTGRIQAYQVFHLDEAGRDWRTSAFNLWHVEQYLGLEKHQPLFFSDRLYQTIHRRYLRDGPIKKGPFWW